MRSQLSNEAIVANLREYANEYLRGEAPAQLMLDAANAIEATIPPEGMKIKFVPLRQMPCPKCRHGNQGGHNGRSCLALVPEYCWEYAVTEYSWCGCNHKFNIKDSEEYFNNYVEKQKLAQKEDLFHGVV